MAAALAACEAPPAPPVGEPGTPLEGLSPAQLEGFVEGQRLFNRDFGPEQGLGPLFNDRRCSSCHDLPSSGGSSADLIRKATRWAGGRCDLLEREGGDNIQQRAVEALRDAGVTQEQIPASATHVADVNAPALYGLGLIEAIPEATLHDLADPDDTDGDGISGRIGRSSAGQPARFGQKADASTLREFIAGALLQEMGLTSGPHPEELTINGRTAPPDVDMADDPEIDDRVLDAIVDYVRFLAPVRPAEPTDAADSSRVARGLGVFHEIGCASCHVPILETGPDPDPVFDRTRVLLYSDLLLHDMGEDLADICGPGAAPWEWRTARLNGLRFRPMLLHNARGSHIDRVIELHGGEAAESRSLFRRLSPDTRTALLRFLETL
ncbi:MAG TPA: di-heme oxidoredictase family protein [Longimicrobiales bacterium]|nr:di-heme oxidoredictase family protein [Longimicrobiales bacterium]